jgi:hypothetical protein
MTRTRVFMPAAVALAIAMATGPAFGQAGSGSEPRRTRDRSARVTASDSQDRTANADRPRGEVAVRRTAPHPEAPRANPAPNRGAPPASQGNRPGQGNNGSYNSGQYSNRGNDPQRSGGGQYDNRSYNNRGNGGRGHDDRGYNNRYYGNRGYSYPGYGRYNSYPWRSHIRYGLGVSIFAGRAFGFHFGYNWRPNFAYHYPIRVGVTYGGMSFLVDPDYTEVYVDGQLVGIARDFGGRPVPVAPGYHRIELYAPGFEPVGFDVNVMPGQVIPYRGSLYRVF